MSNMGGSREGKINENFTSCGVMCMLSTQPAGKCGSSCSLVQPPGAPPLPPCMMYVYMC
jgi:hypothetical protein